ncbi:MULTISPECIES: YaiO family outer membrane beta-barrel protein [Sphingobacterium]|uniref:YaiO family outer membrane beta-barrel protein n=1 Tax=Sphingobacterium tenebrionis TaxID=3111775 RepID=A0ABU8I4T8_9SPHI|nr:YaiO family outer membrane beta-barrel protein [Sphingobacterium sp. CZ-2]QBR11492.1 YaiO family outer membrane beta-barrel protein [Sphingobacterium sp. CZ-2]
MNTLKKYSNTISMSLLQTLIFLMLGGISSVQAQQKVHISDKEDVVKQIAGLLNKGDLNKAKQVLDLQIAKSPKDSDLRMFLGKYYWLRKDYSKARFELNKSVAFNPGNVDAKHLLVAVEMETGRYSSAICYVNELLEVNPYWRGLWRKKIDLYRLQGNHVEADRLLKRISQIFPDDKELEADRNYQAELKANDLRKSGKIEDAIAVNKLLIQEKPNQLALYHELANNYIKAGDYYAALSTVDRGLTYFPGNGSLVDKKISILEHDKRYDEILSLLQAQSKGGSGINRTKYNYFLLEAARHANAKDPATLYGKILEADPGNVEAFPHVLNKTIANQQYDEALHLLRSYANVRGMDKALSLRELDIYRLKADKNKVRSLTRSLFLQHPNDTDIKAAYVASLIEETRADMAANEYRAAIPKLNEILNYGEAEERDYALNSMYNAYYQTGRFSDAIVLLQEKINLDPRNVDLKIKLSGIYEVQEQYERAAEIYESVLTEVSQVERENYVSGYNDLMLKMVKLANEQGNYPLAYQWTKRWLKHFPQDKYALMYGVNLSNQLGLKEEMLAHAQMASNLYPQDIPFKLKLANAQLLNGANIQEAYDLVKKEIALYPYHEEVRNTFVQFSTDYANNLLKNKADKEVIAVADQALYYKPQDKELKYLKGLAYEKLKQYDSAYYYQSFYEPSLLELEDFKAHLQFLNQKGFKNEVGLYHLRSRFGDNYTIQSISTFEYSRFEGVNTFIGRINYSGRSEGKGIQGQLEWGRGWDAKWATKIDAAISNKYFPKTAFNASVYRQFKNDWELELGAGYRQLYTEEHLYNGVLGLTKEINSFRLNAKYMQFFLDGHLLYNVGLQGRYYMNNPKNYLMAMANIGNSPDVMLLNYQFINSFSVMNAMVGAGVGRMVSKHISAGVLGTWYNYETHNYEIPYRNLYNLYFQVNVSF